jgi:hypothetical protein
MDKGTFAANAGLSFGWDLGVGGGAEYVLARVDIADVLPLTFGAAGRGYFSMGIWGYSSLDIAVLGTVHVGFKGLDLPADLKNLIDPIDYYAGLGIGFNIYNDYYTDRFPLGLTSISGASYFLNDNFAINFEGGGTTYSWGYGMIGVLFKF